MSDKREQMIKAIFHIIESNLEKIIAHQDQGNRYTIFPGEVMCNGVLYSFKTEVISGKWQITITPDNE